MICKICDNQIPDDSRYCPHCGAAANVSPQYNNAPGRQQDAPVNRTMRSSYADPYEPNENAYSGDYQNGYYDDGYAGDEYAGDEYAEDEADYGAKKNKALIGIIAGLGSVILILLVVLLVVVFKGRSDSKPNSPTASPSSTQDQSATSQLPSDSLSTASTSVPSGSVAPNASSAVGTITTGAYRVNTQKDDLNIRSGAGTEHAIIGRIPKDTTVMVTAVNGSWAYVTYGSVSGWVAVQYLVPVVN